MPNGIFTLRQQVDGLRQGAWTNQKTPFVNYLVVAGGGGSVGNAGCGGGGAGGLLAGTVGVSAGVAITATVGAGAASQDGNNSSFGSIAATGGGGSGAVNGTGGFSGGSGGGAGIASTSITSGGAGVFGQGNAGGSNGSIASPFPGGGGGGAGTAGLNGTAGRSGNGGAGVASAISGSLVVYAGGGGGGDYNGATPGVGGAGGGGNGNGSSGSPGAANTGGGSGGGTAGNNGSSTGGSGIVIISYPDTYLAPTATTGSPTVSTSGSGSIYNAGAGTVQFTGTATPFTFTGDFTIEGWYNLANFNNAAGGGNPSLVSSGSTGNWLVAIPGGTYVFYSGGNLVLQTSAVASANVWSHFAVVRSGTTVTIYHNGTSVGTATLSGTVTGAATTTVSANGTGGVGSVTGYMSNVRIVKGTAVYTGAFTPSTIPLTAITNTQLLMNAMSGGFLVDGSVNSFTPTTSSGSLAWNQLSPFTVTGYKNRVYTWTSSGSITF
jgi:hypothetical protein